MDMISTELLSQVFSYALQEWANFGNRADCNAAYEDLCKYQGVCWRWRAIIRNRMLAEMASWDDDLYKTRFLMFAKYGQLLGIDLSFMRQDPMRMSMSRDLSCQRQVPRCLSLAECALRHAVYAGSLVVATVLLKKGVDVEAVSDQTDGEDTALYCAAVRGDVRMTQLFLKFGAKVNATASRQGRTALHGAVCSQLNRRGLSSTSLLHARQSLAVTRLLLEHGADVCLTASKHEMALHRAAYIGYSEVVDLLIQHGANVESRMQCKTPLMMAARNGHLDAIQVLLGNGAEVDATLPRSRATALTMAVKGCYEGSDEPFKAVILTLLDHGADINGGNGNQPPLCIASYKGSVPLVELLLEHGADVEKRNAQGMTSLQLVCTQGTRGEHWWVMNLLLDYGADVNESASNGGPALAAICRVSCERPLWVRLFLIQRLVQGGAEVNGCNSRGQTPIMIALTDLYHIQENRFCVVELLLDLGANALAENCCGQNSMHLVWMTEGLGVDERVELFSLLLRHLSNSATEQVTQLLASSFNLPLSASALIHAWVDRQSLGSTEELH